MVNNDIQPFEDFRVFGLDNNDKSYFVVCQSTSKKDAFWCNANQQIRVGKVVRGRLIPKQHPEALPMLEIF